MWKDWGKIVMSGKKLCCLVVQFVCFNPVLSQLEQCDYNSDWTCVLYVNTRAHDWIVFMLEMPFEIKKAENELIKKTIIQRSDVICQYNGTQEWIILIMHTALVTQSDLRGSNFGSILKNYFYCFFLPHLS